MEQLTLKPHTDPAARPTTAYSRTCRVATADLLEGMYVSELDRPWVDTAFMVEGFLLDSPAELAALREQCAYVYVDHDLSDPSLARHLAQLEQRARLSSTAIRQPLREPGSEARLPRRTPRHLNPFSPHTRQHFRALLAAQSVPPPATWLARIGHACRRVLRASGQVGAASDDAGLAALLSGLLPPDTRPVTYPEAAALTAELPAARTCLQHTLQAQQRLLAAVAAGQTPNLDALGATLEPLTDSLIRQPDALLWAEGALASPPLDAAHGMRVALYLMVWGRHAGLPRAALITLARIGLCADVGKSLLPRSLLDKPGMLSPAELSVVRQHVDHSLSVLRHSGLLSPELEEGIGHHHERIDGSGYPHGLQGSVISMRGRMTAIVDVFAALITPRPYAHEVSAQEALMSVYEWSGRSFDEALVRQFVHAIGIFPVGRLVELASGEVAAVVQRHPTRPAEPSIVILSTEDKRPLASPLAIDLAREAHGREPAARRILRGLPMGAYGIKLPAQPPLPH